MNYLNGYPIIKSKADLEEAVKSGELYVQATCPKCGDSWTSLILNAKLILEHGCLCCIESNNWEPKIIKL